MKTKVAQKLIFAITEVPFLGYLFEPYVVDLTKNGELSLSFRRVTAQTVDDYLTHIPEACRNAINIIDEYSDEELSKRFSKKQVKSIVFLQSLEKEKMDKLVRPYIDKRLNRCLDIFQQHHINIHFQGKKKDAIQEHPIEIKRTAADVIFHFYKIEEGIQYHLSMQHAGKNIKFTNKDGFLLSNIPCWLYLHNTLYWFKGDIDSKKIEPFLNKSHILIRREHEKAYVEKFIKNAILHYQVEVKGFVIKELHLTVKTHLQFDKNLFGEPVLLLEFHYGSNRFFAHDTLLAQVNIKEENGSYTFEKVIRDPDWEKKQKEIIQTLGLEKFEASAYRLPEKEASSKEETSYHSDKNTALISWINAQENTFQDHQIEITQKGKEQAYFMGEIRLSINIEQQADWFDLYGKVHFGSQSIPFMSLRDHIINGIREYKLPNGEIAIIPYEWFAKYGKIMRFAKQEKDDLRLKKHHFKLVKSLENEKQAQQQINILEQLEDAEEFEKTPLPASKNITLRPYQIEGYNWINFLRKNNLNGCLADDMGLGKTIQTLMVLLRIKEECPSSVKSTDRNKANKQAGDDQQLLLFQKESTKPQHSHLIVMPLSLIHNWEYEVKKFTPDLKVYVHAGIKREKTPEVFQYYDIILSTYGVVRNDKEMLKEFPFTYLILDESQIIKNSGSKIFKAIKEIHAQHKLTLTGTPIENSLNDLWSQMSFLNDGILGTIKFFNKYFVKPIEKNNDESRQQELRQIISPFILRRTKNKVAKDLPQLTTKVYYCEMTEEQKKIYEKKKSAIRNYILENIEKQGREKSHFIILNGLMQLRMLANHPLLVSEEYKKDSGKFEEIIRSVRKLVIEKHKVLLFSSFVKHLNLIKSYLDENNYQYSMLTGEDSDQKRQDAIRTFQEDEDNRVFLISLKAGGVGLNLTSADYVFILDPWWNPAVENQAINRSHRIGQDKNVFAYKFICRNSIEEKILKLQEEKMTLANHFVNNNNPFRNFSEEDIKELFD